MMAQLWIPLLLAGCGGDDSNSSESNPFDDWGPYKDCRQDVVYTDYDVLDPGAGPYPAGETVTVFTAQGGVLQRDEYTDDYDGSHPLVFSELCSYDDLTHAPLGCETFYTRNEKPELYLTETYGYRVDGLLAWQSYASPDWWLQVFTMTRDESDRVVRIDADRAPTDAHAVADVDGVPDWSDVWIYDGDDTVPSEIDGYSAGIIEDEYLQTVARYTVENDLIVHEEHFSYQSYMGYVGDAMDVHDYTYDEDGHLLTDVRDGGWETYALTWDGDFLMTETHQVAWKDLSDVRTDFIGAATYDCEAP